MKKQLLILIFFFSLYDINYASNHLQPSLDIRSIKIEYNCVKSALNNEEKEVALAVTKLINLLKNPDLVGLQNMIHPLLSYGHSSGKIEDKNGFIENLINGNSDFVEIEIKNQTIIIVGQTAVVRHQLEASIFDNATPSNIKLNIITTWVKTKKGWKLLARQAIKAS